MGYSSKDLEGFGRGLVEERDRRANEKGKELANDLIDRTSNGRGLWFIILWPTWIFITLLVGAFFFTVLEERFSVEQPISFLGFLVGVVFASSWYDWDFTKRHPFFGSIIGWIFWVGVIMFLSNYFHIKI